MRYRTLLLYLDDQPGAGACADHAIRLAREFEGHLLGLSCHRPVPWPDEDADGRGDALIPELRAAEDAAREREAAFAQRCAKAGLGSCGTLRDDAEPGAAVARRALAADLVVMAQADRVPGPGAQHRALVDSVLQHSPRPVLVVPRAGAFEAIARTALVGWDDSPGAARAAAAALPLLRRARQVHLVRFVHPRRGEDGSAREGLNDAAAWLSRHGLDVHARVSASERDVGGALSTEAADLGAGLVVMGAWGRGRLVERVLGGATRSIAAGAAMPILFEH